MDRSPAFDIWLLGPIIVLQLFSFIVLRSVMPEEVNKHLLISLSTLGAFGLVSQIDYRTFIPLSKIFYLISILLLAITILLGEPTRGSTRWITLGSLTFQPSELIKPLLIITFADFAHKLKLNKIKHFLIYLLLILIPISLIFIQPDLGSALVLLFIGMLIAFAGGASYRFFLAIFSISIIFFPIMFNLLKSYQQDRIRIFFDPFSDPLGSGYSVIQSMIAVGAGKVFGRGLGHGTQSQLRFLPERHSDFIFASLAEELGFIGVILVLVSYAVLLDRLIKTAHQSQDVVGSILVIGVFSMLFFQVIVNIGMNIGILPVTGITLPLISSGGSSLLTVMISLGLVQSVSRRKKKLETIEIH